jgi:hypothetical protein
VRNKLTRVAVVGLLLCSLAIIELPELLNLIDNTSNDYSLVVFTRDAPTVVKVQVGMLSQGSTGLTNTQPRWAAASCCAVPLIQPIHTPDNILHRLCVQRT